MILKYGMYIKKSSQGISKEKPIRNQGTKGKNDPKMKNEKANSLSSKYCINLVWRENFTVCSEQNPTLLVPPNYEKLTSFKIS